MRFLKCFIFVISLLLGPPAFAKRASVICTEPKGDIAALFFDEEVLSQESGFTDFKFSINGHRTRWRESSFRRTETEELHLVILQRGAETVNFEIPKDLSCVTVQFRLAAFEPWKMHCSISIAQ